MRPTAATLLVLLGISGAGAARQYDNVYDDAAGYGVDTLETRVERLEKRFSGQALAEMVNEIEKLQSEVHKLRGELEKANHELERVRKQQKEDYSGLDQRVQQIATAQAAAAASPTLPPGASTVPVDPNTPAVSAQPVDPSAPVTATDPATAPPVVAAPPSPPVPVVSSREGDYQKAFARLKEGKYPDAIRDFKSFMTTYPSGEFSDNAQYWLAEAYYVTKDFGAAHEAFNGVIKTFPQSAKISDAMLKIGYIEYETGQYATAREVLGDLIKRYPGSSAAKLADKRLEKMRQENH